MTYHAHWCRYLKAELIVPAEVCIECGTPLFLRACRALGYCDDHICDCPYYAPDEGPRGQLANAEHPQVRGD